MIDATRETFEWLEIKQPFCSQSYGDALCAASLSIGGAECYNTRSSCQDPANFSKGSRALRFCKPQSFIPSDGNYYIPSLSSVQINGGSINPVGASNNSTAIGTRGGLSASFTDSPHTDKYVDPYIGSRMLRDANYIATERGTFWTKWRARNQYYLGSEVKHCIGFIDEDTQQVVDVTTRTYFMTGLNGPSSDGVVSITAKDLLTQFEDKKATAPLPNRGSLLSDITSVATTFTLDPAGIGDEEYAASGMVRVGDECMTFTRSGDVMTVVRGVSRTKADDAKEGEIVQQCLVYAGKTPMFILEDLLKNFAGIPLPLLNVAQWAAEQTSYFPQLYTGTITQPTGVMTLVSEMCEQMLFYPLWDERNSNLNVRAVRPSDGDTIYELDDYANLIADSVTVADMNDQLATQVWIYYGLRNPAKDPTKPENYSVREIVISDEGNVDKNDGERIKQILCRFIPTTGGGAALDLGMKLLARYKSVPKQVSFKTGGKDSAIWLGDFAKISHRNSVDESGIIRPLNVQVLSARESIPGLEFSYTAQEFLAELPIDPTDKTIIIAFDDYNLNLRDVYDSQRGDPPLPGDEIKFIIRSGVVIGARGYEFSETFSGSLKGYYYKTTPTTITRDFAPLMRREATTVTNFAVGATYTSSLRPFELMSDMREVPPSIALDTGTWPSGVTLILTIESGATVIGEGGFCSVHGGIGALSGGFRELLAIASDGGNAMRIRHPITINNSGLIAGGGAGGFPSVLGAWLPYFAEKLFSVQPSGTGAGHILQPALTVADLAPMYPSPPGGISQYSVETTPSGGSLIAGGTGSVQVLPMIGGLRAYGRNAGSPGVPAQVPVQTRPAGGVPPQSITKASKSGREGCAISEGASLITWINKGDVRGAEII